MRLASSSILPMSRLRKKQVQQILSEDLARNLTCSAVDGRIYYLLSSSMANNIHPRLRKIGDPALSEYRDKRLGSLSHCQWIPLIADLPVQPEARVRGGGEALIFAEVLITT